jgi:hypothetical protein
MEKRHTSSSPSCDEVSSGAKTRISVSSVSSRSTSINAAGNRKPTDVSIRSTDTPALRRHVTLTAFVLPHIKPQGRGGGGELSQRFGVTPRLHTHRSSTEIFRTPAALRLLSRLLRKSSARCPFFFSLVRTGRLKREAHFDGVKANKGLHFAMGI